MTIIKLYRKEVIRGSYYCVIVCSLWVAIYCPTWFRRSPLGQIKDMWLLNIGSSYFFLLQETKMVTLK